MGRKGGLSQDQLERLSALLLSEPPTDYGYDSDTWTGPMVIDWMGEKLGVTYKKVQIYNIMNRLGFSYQKAKGSDRRSGMGSYNYESGR